MANLNRVIVLGNLTRDPELSFTKNHTPVCDLGLAVNERRKDAHGEWINEPVFIDVTMWNRLAEVACDFLRKGSPVLIEGRLRLDTFEVDGQRRSKLKVIGENMQLLGVKPSQDEIESTQSVGDEA